jgi:lipoprotein-anchoring transpeptidase ErfK/SrfK
MHGFVNSLRIGRGFRPVGLPLAVALLTAIGLTAAGCGSSPAPPPPPKAAQLTVNGGQIGTDPRPDLGMEVNASGGTLQSVTVADGQGHPVPGYVESRDTAWQSQWALQPGQRYLVTATAVNPARKKTTLTQTVQTFKPTNTFSATVEEDDGANIEGNGVYGVGMPIMLTFDHAITDRAAVERSLQVQTSTPVVGAWHWIDSTHVNFRPKDYWPQYTSVQLTAHLAGVEGAPGIFGTSNLQYNFKIGESIVTYVSASHHYMQVYLNGSDKATYDWPISTGQAGDDTANGSYVSMDKGDPVLMTGPGYTDVPVNDSVRFTWSGNYIHSAPWSVGDQGSDNVSHGCVNLGPDYAVWYYDHAMYGDPITVSGSPVPGQQGDGWTDWFLSWSQLVGSSATGQAVVTGPTGSYFTNPVTASTTPAPSPSATPSGGAKTAKPTHSGQPAKNAPSARPSTRHSA